MKRYQRSELYYRIAKIGAVNRVLATKNMKKTLKYTLSPQEAEAGERSAEEMRRIVSAACAKWPKRCRKLGESAERMLDNSPYCQAAGEREAVRTEILFDCLAYGFSAEEFACYELHGLSPEEKRAFVSSRECIRVICRLNSFSAREVFNNKGRTNARFGEYYKRDAVYISSDKDYGKYAEFVGKHPIFVKKAVFEAMGRSVELIDLNALGVRDRQLFDKLIAIGPHLLEERVVQSETMARLNESSVNTIRCITFHTRHGITDPYYFLKVGRRGSFVDNGGAGGILVGIDRETGKLNTDGFDEFDNRYEAHPDSGVVFKGYQLPQWEQMKKVCMELSAQIPQVGFIGWDMAHTDDGWVLIEGNGMSQIIGPQTVQKRGVKAELEKTMSDMRLYI